MPLPDLSPKPRRPRPASPGSQAPGTFPLTIWLAEPIFKKLVLYKDETFLSYRRIVEKALADLFSKYSFQELKTATVGVLGEVKEFKR